MRAFNVLVIDDDPSIRQLLQKLLADRPRYRTLIAGSGGEALKCLTEERVDVVLSDIHMPGFTGIELLRDMQRVNIRPEILIMTANATPENVESARAIGARSMLVKPFDDLSVVEEEIEKAVREVEARGETPAPPPRPAVPGPPAFSNPPRNPGPPAAAPRSPAPMPPAPAPRPAAAAPRPAAAVTPAVRPSVPAPPPVPEASDEADSSDDVVEIDADESPSAGTGFAPSARAGKASSPIPVASDDPLPPAAESSAADADSEDDADSVVLIEDETPPEDSQSAAPDDAVRDDDVSFALVDEPELPALPDFDAWKTAAPAAPAPPHTARSLAPPVRDLLMLPDEIAPDDPGPPDTPIEEPEMPEPAAPEPVRARRLLPIEVVPADETPQDAPHQPEPTSTSWLEPPSDIKEWAEPAPGTAAWAEPETPVEAKPLPARRPRIEETAPASPVGGADIPEELAEILRMDQILDLEKMKIQVPIICLQTWEEETAMASLRAVCSSLKREFHSWSAASGLVKDGGASMGDAYRDPNRALEFIRRQKRRALYVLADFRHYLEDPAVVRVLREMVMARETIQAMLVLTAPRLTIPPELARVTAAFEWPAFDVESLRTMFEEIRKEVEASSGKRIDLDPEEAEALLSVMVEMPIARARFEITRALMALMNRA